MKAFQLPPKTQAKLVKATPHKEFDGKSPLKQAISLRLRAKLSLAFLTQINPRLPAMLVRRRDDADVQQPVEGVPPIVLERLAPEVKLPITLDSEFTGYTALVDRAMGGLELYGCRVSKIQVAEVIPEGEHGIGEIEFSVGSDEKITPELVGALCDMEGADVWVGLKAPDKPVEEAQKTKARNKKDRLEAQGQQRLTEATGAEIDGSTGPTPESVLADAVAREGGPEDDPQPDGEGLRDRRGERLGAGGREARAGAEATTSKRRNTPPRLRAISGARDDSAKPRE